jgi:hypothetical protein
VSLSASHRSSQESSRIGPSRPIGWDIYENCVDRRQRTGPSCGKDENSRGALSYWQWPTVVTSGEMHTLGKSRTTMGEFARWGAVVVICSSVVSACAPEAKRPPYTNSDQEGHTPPAPRPGEPEIDAGETATGEGSDGGTSGEVGGSEGSSSEGAVTTEPDVTIDPNAPLPDGFTRLGRWAGGTEWSGLRRMIAASPAGEVYVSDGASVYKVVDGETTVFAELAELGYEDDYALPGIAVDGTGNVHVFVQPTGEPAVDHVLDSQGNAVEVTTVSDTLIHYPTVSPEGDVFFVDTEGVKSASSGSGFLIAGVDELGGAAATGCDAEALVVGPGRFFYLPGCEGSPIYFGFLDGSYNQLLVEISDVQTGVDHIVGENHYYGFEGIAPHPLGGVVLNFEQLLLRIHDNGSWELFSTAPWPGRALPEGSPFHSSPVAIDQANVYLLAGDDIWKVEGALAP